ncbi:MAG: Crp/Fnr family transcriptional regulator [Pirellulales bacterium]|nr:Crp/Fnr family transcriptional regulator [Pirellulales bacterium]
MPMNVADILHGCKLFSGLDDRAFRRLATMAVVRSYPKGKVVFRQGDPCPGAFVVGRGQVRVFTMAGGGKQHVLHLVGPGGTFAEVAAIGGFACPASVETLTATTCAVLPTDPLRRALAEDHGLCLGLLAGLTGWVRHLVGLMEDIVLRDAAGRVARLLLETEPAADGTIRLPGLKRHVASHLNLTSETFSRVLRRLADDHLVGEAPKGRLHLLDRRRLAQLAKGVSPKW